MTTTYEAGDTVKWYPGVSDYPSIVRLLRKVGVEDYWVVAYWDENPTSKTYFEWLVPKYELSVKVDMTNRKGWEVRR